MVNPLVFDGLPDSGDPAFRSVYISGPMTGVPEFNRPVFNREAAYLRALGFEVENPAENLPCGSWLANMRLAITRLVRCDWVLMLPGWRWSKGAKIEHRLARDLGLRIEYAKAATR